MNSFGDEIKFDENGDPAAMYDLVIWQLSPRGEMEFTTIGKFDETATVGEKKLHIQRQNFSWSGNQTDVGLLRNCDGVLSHTFPTAAAALCYCVRCHLPFPRLPRSPCQYAAASVRQAPARQSGLISLFAATTVWFAQQGRLAINLVRSQFKSDLQI